MKTFLAGALSLLCCAVIVMGEMDKNKTMEYLSHYQYMGHNCPHQGLAKLVDTDPDMALRMGIMMFQKTWGLRETGEMDRVTMKMMEEPRCGFPDMNSMEDIPGDMMGNMTRRSKRYSLFGGKWPNNQITYRFINYPRDGDMTRAQVESETARAFMVWEAVTPLRFRQVSGTANINIRFESGRHGDGGDFDGRGGTLAHAYAPTNGDTHFDEDEVWTLYTYAGTNYFQVAAHEFGHALGLGHSNIQSALMAPYYRGYQPEFRLHSDDIAGIQARYGMPTAPRPTQPPVNTQRPPVNTPRPPVNTPRPPVNPPSGNPQVCNDFVMDAITLVHENGREVIYGFRGSQYFAINPRGSGIERGYPRQISSKWRGLPSNINSALYLEAQYRHQWRWTGTRWVWERRQTSPARNYFMKGRRVWKYENGNLASGFPRYIYREFPGLPSSGNVGSAFIWNGNGALYFTIGRQYYRLNKNTLRVERGYPQPLSHWRGLPRSIDAALKHTNRWTYVFSGPQYYRLSDSSMTVLSSYPRDTNQYWLRCGL